MAQPLPYERDFDFEFFQSQHPTTPLPADKVNDEFDQVAATFDQVLDRIARLQDDDLQLKRRSVGYDQFKPEVRLGFAPPTTWASGVQYSPRDTVFHDASFYACVVAHKSGVFVEDLADGYWVLIADFTTATQDAEAAAAQAQAAKTAAEAARDAAQGSATSASGSASSALSSATDAATSASAAAASAAEAVNAAQAAQTSANDAAASSLAAQAAQTAAEAARDKARQWADADEDIEVEPGKYSAKNWALKAEEAVTGVTFRNVETRTALKALNPTATPFVYLTEPYREGQFIWRVGDYSLQVAADVFEGTFIKADRVATNQGAWVRLRGSANHSVVEYGADPTGADSAVANFSAAVKCAPAAVTQRATYAAMPLPDTVIIDVPDGTYKIDDYVDLSGRDVVWRFSDATVIIDGSGNRNAHFLQGRIFRRNRLSLAGPSGILDTVCGHSIHVGAGSADQSAQVVGFTDPTKVGMNDTLDLVGQELDVTAPALIHQTSASSFTATSAVLSNPVDVRRLVRGMFVQTTNVPPERGQITNWSSDGKEITVTGWFPVTPGTASPGVIPPAFSGVLFNTVSKIFVENGILKLPASGYARTGTGYEMDVENNVASPANSDSIDGRTWGFDVVNFGSYKVSSGFIARGAMLEGFRAAGPDVGFEAKANDFYPAPSVGYSYQGSGYVLRSLTSAGSVAVAVNNTGMDLGDRNSAGPYAIRARTSGISANGYDSQIVFSGGASGNGNGEIALYSSAVRTRAILPLADNQFALGGPSNRWTQLFAATGTINTSDGRLKIVRGELTDAEMRAVDRVMAKGPVLYQWISSLEEKGDDARLHAGFTAQDWVEAFEAEGLDWRRYAAFCEDDVFDVVEVEEECQVPLMEDYEFEETVPVLEGDRYVQKTMTVTRQRPKTEQRPLFDQDGNRVLDNKGNPVSVTHTVTTTETIIRQEMRPTGEKRLGLRYDQVWAMIWAWQLWRSAQA